MDHIKSLLEATGLSADDLIKKLGEYKAQSETNVDSSKKNEEKCEKREASKKYEFKVNLINGNETYKVDEESAISRLKITDLISSKLQNMDKIEPISAVEIICTPEISDSKPVKHGMKRKPIHGLIRRNIDRKKRMTKPPWLIDKSNETIDGTTPVEKEIVESPLQAETIESEEENVGDKQEAAIATTVDTTREKIFSQLQQLRCRKDVSPLIDLKSHTTKRFVKRNVKNVDNVFGIKIVDVQGGVTASENKKVLNKTDTAPRIEKANDESYQMINEHLNSNVIELSKTKDYRKIKGWKSKKILYPKTNLDSTVTNTKENCKKIQTVIPDACEPSCSYTTTEVGKKDKPSDITVFESDALDNFLELPINDESSLKVEMKDECKEPIVNVFASNSLDGFLDEQRHLNISYDIPNLESSVKKMDPYDPSVIMQDNNIEVKADNKRLFSIAETESSNCILQNIKTSNKPRTLAEKRKLLDKNYRFHKKLKIENGVKKGRKGVYSTVFYKGGKVKVYSRYQKNVQVYRKYKKKTYSLIDNKKRPSIYLTQTNEEIAYRPGPITMKSKLQFSAGNWQTYVKELPKVFLEVTPELGKKFHPRIKQFLKFDSCEITAERADFALSALNCSKKEKKVINFPIPYEHNQKYIVLRKEVPEIKKEVVEAEVLKETAKDIENTIRIMMDDMLRYVDVKEKEPTLLKKDPDVLPPIEIENILTKTKSTKTNRTEGLKGASKRTSLELKRLNVKVIEVDIGEEDDEHVKCVKTYCKFGCVCKSISGMALRADHCAEAKCIFKCICGFEETNNSKYRVPSCSDLLSDRTVNRLQAEAKKDLAKEEKEFTQTVIQAKNQTIVLGDKSENRRRSTKLPKKYEDYYQTQLVCDIPLLLPITPIPVSTAKRTKNEEEVVVHDKLLTCSVNLERCDFDHIIPYCLVHRLYDCYCKCTSDIETVSLDTSVHETTFENNLGPNMEMCARTQVNDNLLLRKTNKVKKYMAKRSIDGLASPEKRREIHEIVYISPPNIDQINHTADPLLEPIAVESLEKSNSRRKQLLKTRLDDLPVLEPAIQRRNKSQKQTIDEDTTALKTFTCELQSNGDWFQPSDEVIQKFATFVGDTDVQQADFRLLLWTVLMQKYTENKVDIWTTMKGGQYKFIITGFGAKKIFGYRNIRWYESLPCKNLLKNDFIKSIVTNTCPSPADEENVLVILKGKNDKCYEVCGMCKKTNKGEVAEKQTVPNALPAVDDITKVTNELVNNTNNKYKTVQQVVFTNASFLSKILQLKSVEQLPNVDQSIEAPLPSIQQTYKWRVLKVSNSNFSVLSFNKNDFRIKCSDILTVIKIALKYNRTIIINTPEIAKNYAHDLFGIYIVSNYSDRIFIGPYFDEEQHELETLRFVNNVLINTEIFNKMQGKELISTTGHWYTQVGQVDVNSKEVDEIIDLTSMEEQQKKVATPPKAKPTPPPLEKIVMKSILKPVTIVLNELPANEFDKLFNARFLALMSDKKLNCPKNAIPICFRVNFDSGVIFGYQTPLFYSVFWPGDKKAKKFPTAEEAVKWLHREFKNNFVFVPSHYNPIITLFDKKNYLESNTYVGLNEKYFQDLFIISKFGFINILELTIFVLQFEFLSEKSFNYKHGTKSYAFLHTALDLVGKDNIKAIEFINKAVLQLKQFIISQKNLSNKLFYIKAGLKKQQILLISKRNKLITKTDAALGQKLEEDFKKKWKSFVEPTILESEVICLDSDDEETKDKSNTINGNHNGIQNGLRTEIPDTTITPIPTDSKNTDITSTKQIENNLNHREANSESDIKLKRRPSTEIIAVPMNKKNIVPTKCKDVEYIDLSHMSSAKIQTILGTNIHNNQVKLSRSQINGLKALSHNNRMKKSNTFEKLI